MPGRANDLLVIPDSFWQRAEVLAALRGRTVSRLFQLLRQYTGASQTQIAIACGTSQGKVSDIMRGMQQVESPGPSSSASPTPSACPTRCDAEPLSADRRTFSAMLAGHLTQRAAH